MMNPDDLIFDFRSHSRGDGYDNATWLTIVSHVLERLSSVLGQEGLHVDDGMMLAHNGFSVRFRSKATGSKPWQFGLRGIVGGEPSEGAVLVRAWLYPYWGNTRLTATNRGDVALLKYVQQEQGGAWISDGWEFEEYNESPDFEQFDQG
jgi:hypothetical protein